MQTTLACARKHVVFILLKAKENGGNEVNEACSESFGEILIGPPLKSYQAADLKLSLNLYNRSSPFLISLQHSLLDIQHLRWWSARHFVYHCLAQLDSAVNHCNSVILYCIHTLHSGTLSPMFAPLPRSSLAVFSDLDIKPCRYPLGLRSVKYFFLLYLHHLQQRPPVTSTTNFSQE